MLGFGAQIIRETRRVECLHDGLLVTMQDLAATVLPAEAFLSKTLAAIERERREWRRVYAVALHSGTAGRREVNPRGVR